MHIILQNHSFQAPEDVEVKLQNPATVDEVEEVTPGFRLPYSPKKAEKDEEGSLPNEDKDIEIASDALVRPPLSLCVAKYRDTNIICNLDLQRLKSSSGARNDCN